MSNEKAAGHVRQHYRSLFIKYFQICVAIIMLSITFLGVVLLLFATQYFKNDKFRILEANVNQAVSVTMLDYSLHDYEEVSGPSLLQLYQVLGQSIDAKIFLVDSTGKTLLCSETAEKCVHSTYMVPRSVILKVASGHYQEMGNLGGLYKDSYFTVGKPLINPYTNEMVGMVFSSASAEALVTFLGEMFKMFAISALAAIAVAFIIIYFITSSMVRPLQEMVAATQSFAKGDFTVRVPVESEDEVGQLATAFNSMAAALTTMETMHRSFTANVSHELKTPMTTIAGFVDGILDGTIPPEKQNQYLRIVSDEVKRLSRLVQAMLSLSRIESGQMTIKPVPVDLNDLVCRTVFTFERPIESKQIQIEGLDSDAVMVNADPDMIHQVVYNLIENAVKFVNEGGTIQFTYRTEGGMTYLAVRNTGEGIAPEEIPKLFDRFYKSDRSRSLDKTGVGLGLYIVKTIIGLHGGDITVSSVQGQYSEFTFCLPAVQPAKEKRRFHNKGEEKEALPG